MTIQNAAIILKEKDSKHEILWYLHCLGQRTLGPDERMIILFIIHAARGRVNNTEGLRSHSGLCTCTRTPCAPGLNRMLAAFIDIAFTVSVCMGTHFQAFPLPSLPFSTVSTV